MPLLDQMANAWRIRDLRHKILITLGLLALCRVGVFIPLPDISVEALSAQFQRTAEGLGVLGLLNLFTGGALGRGALFALGIMPYITASIIFTLLSNVIPSLEALRREGAAGQRKLNQYMRLTTVGICLFQGTFLLRTIMSPQVVHAGVLDTPLGTVGFLVKGAFLLTAGTLFLMWLGEQIDQHGIGNGISMIIMVNILARLPNAIYMLQRQIELADSQQNAILKIIALLALFVAMVVAIVFITRGERRIPVQQQKHVRGPKVYGGQKHYLPLKVNTAGVLPIIFASVLLQFPQMISRWAANESTPGGFWYRFFGTVSDALGPGGQGGISLPYMILYGMLIFFFCYFWTAVVFNPREMSENLQNHGSFIPGIRPGRRTAAYLEGIMNRVTMAGAFFLLVVALMPAFVATGLNVEYTAASFMGGTSILIVVGVTLDLVRRISDHLEMRRYSGFAAGSGGRRRSRRR